MEKSSLQLKDLIKYEAKTYLTEEDKKLIQDHFNGNEKLIRAVRKIFIPSVNDSALPEEEIAKDIFLGRVDFMQVPEDQAKSIAMGLQIAAKMVLGGLIQIKMIANEKEETEEQKVLRREKDSTK